jgi:ClpP class serine protease
MEANPILSHFTGRPLAIHEPAIEQIRQLCSIPAPVSMSASDGRGDYPDDEDDSRPVINRAFRIGADYFGNPVPRMFVRPDATAVIPVKGMLTKGLGNMVDYYGLADYDRIQHWLDIALDDERVKRAALFVASPGGMTIGGTETAEAILRFSARKPIMAFTDFQACSAAYKLSAACDFIVATRSADVGSVGTFAYMPDATRYWQEMGIEWLVFRSGAFTGAGIDKFTEEQKAEIQREIDSLGTMFRNFVRSRRPGINEEDLQGQVFNGQDALEHGFVHGLANNFEEALSRFKETQNII